MALNFKLSFPWRISLIILGVAWLAVANLVGYQYFREKEYRAQLFDSRLQIFNNNIINELNEGKDINTIINATHMPIEGLRVSIINRKGKVLYDSSSDTLLTASHLNRPEIATALAKGSGYTIRRHSQSTDISYFYSATSNGSIIVRSAAPYTIGLQEILAADLSFLSFTFFITIVVSIIGYFFSRKLGMTIIRLKEFATRAERGERIYDNEPFPHDELGDIANNIVRLYARLQQATAENERQHIKALQQEQDKIRLKKELTNNINHELKTPVASIQACIETLMDHDDIPAEKRREFLERCNANIDRLKHLLQDVSLITRMDDGNASISKDDIDLRDIIAEACDDFELIASDKGIAINAPIDLPLPMKGNYSMLLSVFRNLIDNAINYSGGSTIEIRLLSADDARLSLMVVDDGVGVPDEHLPHIFERFYRVDKGRSRQAGGTGLGLAIVKNAILIHSGTITAENRPMGGLSFKITLSRR